jgi:hypothetical protein
VLTAGFGAMEQMLGEDGLQLTGARYSRDESRIGHRWVPSRERSASSGGKVAVRRPRASTHSARAAATSGRSCSAGARDFF